MIGSGKDIKMRVTPELLETVVTRDDNCNRLYIDIGEPDEEGFYKPVIHTDYTDNPLRYLAVAMYEAVPETAWVGTGVYRFDIEDGESGAIR